jgi:predicted flap endonuclease-1-like 5' DNA nuclease
MKIVDVQGIGPAYAAKLSKVKIRTTETLLKRGATPEGRKEIVKASGISHEKILTWVNMADLYRIKGVGSQYSELLEAAGVDTVVELSKRVPEKLLATMVKANDAKNLVNGMPGLRQVKSWVSQAKRMKRVIRY